jgi:hypothetical protein
MLTATQKQGAILWTDYKAKEIRKYRKKYWVEKAKLLANKFQEGQTEYNYKT